MNEAAIKAYLKEVTDQMKGVAPFALASAKRAASNPLELVTEKRRLHRALSAFVNDKGIDETGPRLFILFVCLREYEFSLEKALREDLGNEAAGREIGGFKRLAEAVLSAHALG